MGGIGWRGGSRPAGSHETKTGGIWVLHAVSLAIALAILWLLLSGYFSVPLILALGAASVVLVVLIARRMEVLDPEGHPVHLMLRALLYWPWLIKEIVVANFDVAKAIVASPPAIEPTVFKVKALQKTDLGRVIYANSITLTPGTVTIALEDDGLTVHGLTRASVAGVESGEMDRRVAAVEGKG